MKKLKAIKNFTAHSPNGVTKFEVSKDWETAVLTPTSKGINWQISINHHNWLIPKDAVEIIGDSL